MIDGKAAMKGAVIWGLFILLLVFIAGAGTLIVLRPTESLDLPDLFGNPPSRVEMVDTSEWDKFFEPAFQIDSSEKRMLTSEIRVGCMKCNKLIPVDARTCVFCGCRQPGCYDFDGDGIPDLLEEDVGMDPANPDDAFEDMDGDGFANFVEYDVHNVTWASDPNDVDLKPHVTAKLRLFKTKSKHYKFHCMPVVVGGEEKFKVTMVREVKLLLPGDLFCLVKSALSEQEDYTFVRFEEKPEEDSDLVVISREGREYNLKVNMRGQSELDALLGV